MDTRDLEGGYRLLEADLGASRDEIRKAYLLLVNVWHPDRFAKNPDLQLKAKEKLQAINLAYEGIREAPLAGNRSSPAGKASPTSPPAGRPAARPGRTADEWTALGLRLTMNPGRLRPDGEGLAWSSIANLNEFLEGLRSFREALKVQPGHADAWHGLGLSHLALSEHVHAAAAFEKAVRYNPDHAGAWLGLGAAATARDHHAGAARAFREVVRLRPKDAAAWYALGSSCTRIGGREEAAAAYRQAVRFNPDFPEAWHALGVALAFPGADARVEPDDALAAFRQAVRLKPDLAEAWHGLGATLSGLGRHDEALDALQQAVHLHPESAEAWYSLGVASRYASRRGTTRVVREAYARLKGLNPAEAARLHDLLPYSIRLSLVAFLPRFDRHVAASPSRP